MSNVNTIPNRSLKSFPEYKQFRERIVRNIYEHPVIVSNPYTKKIKTEGFNRPQVEDLFIQFSVFSNHFLHIQCKRMVNAPNEDAEREAREILANEIGISFVRQDAGGMSINGGEFRHSWAHINWLRETAAPLNLAPPHIPYPLGHWNLGSPATHAFLEGLDHSYGSIDGNVGAGASFAIETWAGFGIDQGAEAEHNNFWKELILGLEVFNERDQRPHGRPELDLRFFQGHFDIEKLHVESVEREIKDTFGDTRFDPDQWFEGAGKALHSIYIFWEGLEETYQRLGD